MTTPAHLPGLCHRDNFITTSQSLAVCLDLNTLTTLSQHDNYCPSTGTNKNHTIGSQRYQANAFYAKEGKRCYSNSETFKFFTFIINIPRWI